MKTNLKVFLTLSFLAFVVTIAAAWPTRVKFSSVNENGDAVVVRTCSGNVTWLLVCDLVRPNCRVVSTGMHDMAYLPNNDPRSVYRGQNVTLDNTMVFELRQTAENSPACE